MTDQNPDDDRTQSHTMLTSGTIVQHYRIVERIGAGGMGEVYLAEDTKLDRRVALKFLPPSLANDEDVKLRFTREARAAAKLHHPHIVTVFEVGDHDGRPFIAMEYVEGRLLHDLAHRDSLDTDTIIEYAIQLCQGLGEAHRAGVVHRDIKSANIAVDKNGRTRILDFGLAAIQGMEQLTKTGSTLGTVSYMSPEQVSGREVDHRSDLFSLGVVLYEMIASRTPFKRNSDGATLKAIVEDIPEPLARYRANVPDALQNIVSKLLEKDRDVRYQSAEGVLADLKKMLYDSQPGTRSVATPSPKSRILQAAVAAIVVAIVVVVGLKMFSGSGKESAEISTPVLAVLSFKNLGSAEDDYFSEGITDEIRSRLVGVQGMRVISGSSTITFKESDKNLQQIGRELGADYVLEGTIRWDKSGDVDLIRITPRLTKTSDNYLMWADNYEQRLVQVFDVQSKIADQIVTALGLTLLEPGKEAPDYAPTTNMQAYNYYLRGLELKSKGVFMANTVEVLKMFDSAISLDPSFAVAWAMKSMAHTELAFSYIWVDSSGNSENAIAAAERSLALDPGLPDAHIALGSYYNFLERDYESAMNEFALAKSEVASNASLSEAIGVVKMRQGKWQEALDDFEEASRLDPLSVRRYFWLATCYSYLRDFDKSNQYIDRGLTLAPDDYDAVYFRIKLNLLQYGSVDSDDRRWEDIVSPIGAARVASYEVAPSSTPGFWRFVIDRIDPDENIASLRAIRDEKESYLVYMNVAQIFDLTNRPDSARLYYDSSRVFLLRALEYVDDDFHIYSNLGLAYAYLGQKDSAIWAGNMGKETMPVDECHW